MSDSAQQSPRAVIHKRILDRAEAEPEASLETIADQISGASPELVERVLDRYGDPAVDHPQQAASDEVDADSEPGETGSFADLDPATQSTEPENTAVPDSEIQPMDFDELTDGQREVLRAISRHPEATQAELAERLDVSPATISNRVNAIEGFEWSDREAFVSEVVDEADTASDGGPKQPANEVERQLTTMQEQLEEVERRLDDPTDGNESPLEDPELLAKVVRACVADEDITETEEVQILGALLGQSDD